MKTAITIIAVCCLVVSIFFGCKIPYSEQETIYDSLIGVSGIILAISGIWIAILYPRSLNFIENSQNEDIRKKEIDLIRRLLLPLILSVAVIFVSILAGTIKSIIIYNFDFTPYIKFFRSVSFFILLLLLCVQIYSLILTIKPCDDALRILTKIDELKKKRDRKFKNRRTRRP